MNKQDLVEQLKSCGELNTYRNVKVWIGRNVSEVFFYLEALKSRGIELFPEKYYVFEDSQGKIFVCGTPEEAVDMVMECGAFDYNTISTGDLVDFGHYGRFYVHGENIDGSKFLVNSTPEDEREGMREPFYIEKIHAEAIIKK